MARLLHLVQHRKIIPGIVPLTAPNVTVHPFVHSKPITILREVAPRH